MSAMLNLISYELTHGTSEGRVMLIGVNPGIGIPTGIPSGGPPDGPPGPKGFCP